MTGTFPSLEPLEAKADKHRMAPTLSAEPSNYMQTLTRYLSNIMNSTLLGLPREIKELIYFDALSHAANMILTLPLDPEVKKINPNGVAAMAKDVEFLAEFVDSLDNAMILKDNLEELQQMVALMQTDANEEYFEGRSRKFGRVDGTNALRILEKYVPCPASLCIALSFQRSQLRNSNERVLRWLDLAPGKTDSFIRMA